MPFFLKHYFDPDYDYANLSPEHQEDGSVDHYELNYVQSVEVGSVIAEWISIDESEVSDHDPRFIFEERDFPAGKGTGIRTKAPDRLYAAIDGYVLYEEGKIVVRHLLTIADDVDFHTGNISFIGNVIIKGSVRSGFTVQARDVTIQGSIEGARVEALATLNGKGGVKGNNEAFVEARTDVKLSFCENATLKAGNDVLVQGALMHSQVYAGRRLVVGGRMTGGRYYCYENVYVGGQLGGGLDTDTIVIVGYHPILMFANAEYDSKIKSLHTKISRYESRLQSESDYNAEISPKLEAAKRELVQVKQLKSMLWEGIHSTERLDKCRVMVPGIVKPGVEISIGSAYLKVDDFLEDVYFYYDNYEVRIGTSAKKKIK